ncbi:hypothetical protein [Holospora undulata]|uniref:Uncharacterized protein n=1 Tax=Holospora undulata HU1 TaxID=1321371 RepID=A0A061JIQ6_9PROT|nr:hypothetical protein [Holospora undulata]ETZ05533.1 hypothetical protein K737_300027 [Holospora undulata HU1]
MRKKILLALIINGFGGFFVEFFFQNSYGTPVGNENHPENQQSAALEAELNTLETTLANEFVSKKCEGHYSQEASCVLIDNFDDPAGLQKILNRNASGATALRQALMKVTPERFFEVMRALAPGVCKYVLRVLNNINPEIFGELFDKRLKDIDLCKKKNFFNLNISDENYDWHKVHASGKNFFCLGKVLFVLNRAFNSGIYVDVKKVRDTLYSLRKYNSLSNIVENLVFFLRDFGMVHYSFFPVVAALGRVSVFENDPFGSDTILKACKVALERSPFSASDSFKVKSGQGHRDSFSDSLLNFISRNSGTSEDIAWIFNVCVVGKILNDEDFFELIQKFKNPLALHQILKFSFKGVCENFMHPDVFSRIYSCLLSSDDLTNKKIVFDFLSELSEYARLFDLALRNLFYKEGAFIETLKYLSIWGKQDLFKYAVNTFFENPENFLKELDSIFSELDYVVKEKKINNFFSVLTESNPEFFYRVLDFFAKDTGWTGQGLFFSEMMRRIQQSVLLNAVFNSEDTYSQILKFFIEKDRADTLGGGRIRLLQELSKAYPGVEKNLLVEILKNLPNYTKDTDLKQLESLKRVLAPRLKRMEITIQDDWKIFLDCGVIELGKFSENDKVFHFVRDMMRHLSLSQKNKLLENVLSYDAFSIKRQAHYLEIIGISFNDISDHSKRSIKNNLYQIFKMDNFYLFLKFKHLIDQEFSNNRINEELDKNQINQELNYNRINEELDSSLSFVYKSAYDNLSLFGKYFNIITSKDSSLNNRENALQFFHNESIKEGGKYFVWNLFKSFPYGDDSSSSCVKALVDFKLKTIRKKMDRSSTEYGAALRKSEEDLSLFFENQKIDVKVDFFERIKNNVNHAYPSNYTFYFSNNFFNKILNSIKGENFSINEENLSVLRQKLECVVDSYNRFRDPESVEEAIAGFSLCAQEVFDFMKKVEKFEDINDSGFLKFLEEGDVEEKNLCYQGMSKFINDSRENYDFLIGKINHVLKTEQFSNYLIQKENRNFIFEEISKFLAGYIQRKKFPKLYIEGKKDEDILYFGEINFQGMCGFFKQFSEKYFNARMKERKQLLEECVVFCLKAVNEEVSQIQYVESNIFHRFLKPLRESSKKSINQYVESGMHREDFRAFHPYNLLKMFFSGVMNGGMFGRSGQGKKRCPSGVIADLVKTIADINRNALEDEFQNSPITSFGLCDEELPKKR